jgi:hypothetical protein
MGVVAVASSARRASPRVARDREPRAGVRDRDGEASRAAAAALEIVTLQFDKGAAFATELAEAESALADADYWLAWAT